MVIEVTESLEMRENALQRFTFAFPQAQTLISYYTIFNNKAERIS